MVEIAWLNRRSIVLVALLAAGCTGGRATSVSQSPSPSSSARPIVAVGTDWPTFQYNGVAFRYAPSWHSYPYRWASSFTDSLTYLSTVAVPDPCSTAMAFGGIQTECGQLRSHLGPEDLLIIWTEGGGPVAAGFNALAAQPGMDASFGGHAAKLAQGPAGADCGHTGATHSIKAVIARTSVPNGQTVTMTACLGPGTGTSNTNDVMAMLDSLHITN